MKKRNGFTLIEILAVIIIVGIIMIIAVPAVTKYIFKTNKSVYASDVSAFLESIRGEYEMKTYGNLLKDDEIMVVPIKHIVFEKGNSESSPYGEYDFDRSHILIVPERNAYSFYATVIDSANVGLIKVRENEIGEDIIQEDITTSIPLLSSYDSPGSIYNFNGESYKRSDVRTISGEEGSESYKVYVFKDTGLMDKVKVIQLFSHTGAAGMLEYYYESWRFNGEVVDSVAIPVKNGYTFEGYYKGLNGNGLKVINGNGSIVTDIEEQLGDYTTAYAYFTANPLVFNDVTKNINFSNSNQQITISAATNGTGHYTYTEVSEINTQGTSTNYISINETTITVAGGTPVGAYTYLVNAKDDASGSEKNATITILIDTSVATLVCEDKTYNGSAQNLYTDATGCASVTNGKQTNVKSDLGSWTLTCVPDTNHTAPSTCTAKIKQKDLTIKANNQTLTFGDSIATGLDQVTVTGLVSGDSLTAITLTPSTTNYVANGKITPSNATTTKGINNYHVTYETGKLKINKRKLTITANAQTLTFGDPAPTGTEQVTISGLANGDSLTGVSLALSTTNVTSNGKITPSDATTSKGISNYNVSYKTGKLVINKKSLTITAKDQTVTFGTAITTGTGQVTVNGLVTGDTLTGITLTPSTTSYTTSGKITPSNATTTKGASNYSITYNTGVLKIDKKALTITAKDQTITYGNSIATGISQVTVSGLVTGDNLTAVTLTPSTTSYTTNGTITPSSATSTKGINNYNVTYKPGVLKINTLKCNNPTNVSISSSGVVTWTPSSNCSNAQHQISIDNSNWTNASSGIDYSNKIKASTGTRTVYIRAVAPNTNYSTSSSASASKTVYSVTVRTSTGISNVTGGGNYIAGSTATINAVTTNSHYKWSKWNGTPNSTTQKYSATVNSNWDTTAVAIYLCANTSDRPTYGGYKGCNASCPTETGQSCRDVYHHYYSTIDTDHLCSESTTTNGSCITCTISCGTWHYHDGGYTRYSNGNDCANRCFSYCNYYYNSSVWTCHNKGWEYGDESAVAPDGSANSIYSYPNWPTNYVHCWCKY